MFHYREKRMVEMPASVLISHRLLAEDLNWREDDGPYLYRKHPVTPMSLEEVKELRDSLDRLIELMEKTEPSTDPTGKSASDEAVESIYQSLKEEVKNAKQASQRQSAPYRDYMSGRFKAT